MQQKCSDLPGWVRAGVRKIRIDAEHAGQRVDNFLRRELPGVPKGRVYRMLRRGEVRVNGGRVRPEYKLCQDDELRLPPVRVRINSDTPPEHLAQGLLDRLIYEDKQLLVVDKPAGLAVHGGSGIAFGAVELLRHARPDIRDLELVHRLDRETSGCLVLAKRRSALRELHARFREGRVEKNYLGLVAGRWELGDRMIDAPLLVQHRRGGERYVIVSPQGKPARTRVRLARQVGQYSLLRCEPLTGRTHQIRVHLKHAGFPLLGDERYGESGNNARAAELGLRRLFLHAQSIAFPDAAGNELHFTAPLAEELDGFLLRIQGAR